MGKKRGFFHQLWILSKKNLLIQTRHPWVTLFEFFVPAFMGSMLLIGRFNVPTDFIGNVTVWDEFGVDMIGIENSRVLCELPGNYDIAFTPNSPAAAELVSLLADNMGMALDCPVTDLNSTLENDTFERKQFVGMPFDSVEAMNTYVIQSINSSSIFMGLIFDDEWKNANDLPAKLHYTLRPPAAPRIEQSSQYGGVSGWLTNLLFPTMPPSDGPRDRDDHYGGKPYYYQEGFVTAQHLLDLNFLKWHAANLDIAFSEEDYNLGFQRFPFPPYPSDPFILSISRSIPFIILICFIYLGMQTSKSVAVEKDSGLKEYMLMMGLSRNALWTSHFIHYFCIFLVTVTLVTVVLTAPFIPDTPVIKYTHWSIIFILLLLYGVSLINMGFMISTWFETANSVAATTCVLIFIFFLPYGFIFQNMDGVSSAVRVICSLLSPTAMGFGFSIISAWESRGLGVQWENILDPVSSSNEMTMLGSFGLLILDSLLYYALARYVDVVNPGRWGVARKWYFLCAPSYWCPDNQTSVETTDDGDKLVEPAPDNLPAGFRLTNVVKEFGSGGGRSRAVDNLSFVALDSQITVLLGHNGAGKSTTMNMLSGMLEADEGQCYVGDVNVSQNVEEAREDLGLCPQHNILIRELSVREHFRFFAELKGFTRSEADIEIDTLANEVQLEQKIDQLAYDLSGGMKRKLMLGIALCGGSKNLILDEPSSGIDVRARRELWSVLEKCRKNRTMLLSTHYMDEAEYLADRIVIIAAGKLKCSGSTQFLKEKLGTGYHLTMSLMDDASLPEITKFVQNITPNARLDKFYGKEATYLLPFESSSLFPSLFRALDGALESIQVQSYGISVTTMDEIFTRATSNGKDDLKSSDIQEELLLKLANRITLLTGWALMWQQFRGSFVKCALHALRNWKIIAIQLILPAIMTTLAGIQILAIPVIGYQNDLDLSLSTYKTSMGGKLSVTTVYTAYNDSAGGADFVNAIDGDSAVLDLTDSGVELIDWIPTTMQEDLYNFNEEHIIAMETGSPDMTNRFHTWFNGEAYHSLASAVLYTDRTLIQKFFSESTVELQDNISISARNSPLPATLAQSLEKNTSFTIQGNIISFNLVIGLMIMFSAFSMLPVRERETGVKTMQRCSGVPQSISWAAEYLWDYINSIPPLLITCLVFVAFQSIDGIKVYVDNIDALIALLFMFSLAQLPFGYCCSFLFDNAAAALTYCSLINIVLGLITSIIVSILEVPGLDFEEIAEKLDWAFCIFPQYDLARGLYVLYLNANIKKICTESIENQLNCEYQQINYATNQYSVEDGGIGRNLIALALLVPALFAILALIEYEQTTSFIRRRWRRMCRCCSSKVRSSRDSENKGADAEDSDVTGEKKQIDNQKAELISKNPLVVDRLCKSYGAFTAVDEISFLVQPNRCFGLLGPNGAGKTSLFKMLTGEHQITSGSAFINKFNVQTDRFNALREFGYCPQFDALLSQLTGKETLVMYARLRGVPESSIPDMVDNLLLLVGIEQYGDKTSSGYSGGTKRKLSVAVALTGFPPVLMMDEPSCGLDPGARRQLWSVISGAQKAGAAVVLTSHSMEEVAALCNNLAIMVNGQMRCIGGQQYLKSKFGHGVEVEVQIERDSATAALEKITTELPYLKLVEQYQSSMKFQPEDNILLGDIFEALEELKSNKTVTGYTVHQATLEQIFLDLTENQQEEGGISSVPTTPKRLSNMSTNL